VRLAEYEEKYGGVEIGLYEQNTRIGQRQGHRKIRCKYDQEYESNTVAGKTSMVVVQSKIPGKKYGGAITWQY
jgi:hypothetical protein